MERDWNVTREIDDFRLTIVSLGNWSEWPCGLIKGCEIEQTHVSITSIMSEHFQPSTCPYPNGETATKDRE